MKIYDQITIGGVTYNLVPTDEADQGCVKLTTPFDRSEGKYFFITSCGGVDDKIDIDDESVDGKRYAVANYCHDKALITQREYRETLNRLLWRFSMENDGLCIDWKNEVNEKYKIIFNHSKKEFEIDSNEFVEQFGIVYFYTADIAKRAIKEIVEPFMKAHPDFRF